MSVVVILFRYVIDLAKHSSAIQDPRGEVPKSSGKARSCSSGRVAGKDSLPFTSGSGKARANQQECAIVLLELSEWNGDTEAGPDPTAFVLHEVSGCY